MIAFLLKNKTDLCQIRRYQKFRKTEASIPGGLSQDRSRTTDTSSDHTIAERCGDH